MFNSIKNIIELDKLKKFFNLFNQTIKYETTGCIALFHKHYIHNSNFIL